MIAAVTGATGFVGRHLVGTLRRAGHDVRCLVRSSARGAPLVSLGATLVPGALEDSGTLGQLAAGADVLFHLAGLVKARSQEEFLRANRDGTARVAEASLREGVSRMVYVSSLAATGPTERGQCVDETTAPHPVTRYGRSKLAGEVAVRESGIAFTIVRPPAVYGPHDVAFLDLFRLARRGLVPLLGDGLQELSLVHAADLAEALLAVAAAPLARGRVYHACHPEIVTQRSLATSIGSALGTRPRMMPIPAPLTRALLGVTGLAAAIAGRATLLHPDKAHEFLAPAWVCSAEAIASDAAWHARIPLAQGLAETAAWYRKEAWL